MKKLSGSFSLIELVVYSFCFALLSRAMFGFFSNATQQMSKVEKRNKQEIAAALALDLIRRDCLSASMDAGLWGIDAFVFQKSVIDEKGKIETSCVGWGVSKYGVVRLEGVYDFKEKKWHKKTVSYFACPITSLHLSLRISSDKKNVEQVGIHYVFTMVSDKKKEEACVVHLMLRNRVIP